MKKYEYGNDTVNSMTDQMQAVRDTVIEILRENGVKRAAFFGSIVRGEMNEESDIDILIEFEGRRSLLDLAHLKNELEDAANRRVDLLTLQVASSQAERSNPRRAGSDIRANRGPF